MSNFQKKIIFALRVLLGWVFLYAGLDKVLNPSWSAGGYLGAAKNLHGFYAWFASPGLLPVTNFINEWGLVLLGVSLILGIFVKWSSIFGIILMLLYYFSAGQFPFPDANSLLVDEHIIYAALIVLMCSLDAGKIWGIDSLLTSK
ncbi:DoxX family protein [Patescibacteria group bacterium]|nr:DoxX family protein [Patescibacteria group bacterium]